MSNGNITTAEAPASAVVLNGIMTGEYQGQQVRIGSRKVRIIHYPKSNMLPKDKEAKQIRDEVVKKISPGWKRDSKDVNRPITRAEEIIYLPSLMGVKPESNEWEQRTKNYWFDFSVVVPAKGIELEAGFKYKDGSDTKAEPIDIMGYISYRVAVTHSLVAKEDDDNPAVFDFKIIDLAKQIMDEENMFAANELAERAFHRLAVQSEKTEEAKRTIDYILELKGGPDFKGMNIRSLSPLQKRIELKKFVAKYPSQFRDLVDDPKLETRALLRRAVSTRVITHEGTTYVYQGKMLGNSETVVVAWLDDPANNNEKVMIEFAVKEYLK